MTRGSGKWTRPLAVLAVSAMLHPDSGKAQSPPRSPSDLIKFLSYQSGREDVHGTAKGIFTCAGSAAEYREDLGIAETLATIGAPALADIEAALSSVEERGLESDFALNSNWLLYAYAKIRGPGARPRLQRMLADPKLSFLYGALDNATATALSITSYVTSSRELLEAGTCSGVFNPRYMLDQLILAWEKGDRHRVAASLGPDAESALQRLLAGTTWQLLRAKTRPKGRRSGAAVAVGYSFVTPGWWSQPTDEPFQADADNRRQSDLEIETQFKNQSARDCGTYRVKFVLTKGYYAKYQVNNADLTSLFRVISACLAQRGGHP